MKLENQVTSLELSKRLKELGVKQDSLFWWCHSEQKNFQTVEVPFHIIFGQDGWVKDFLVAAFTVAELGEMYGDVMNSLPRGGEVLMSAKYDGEWRCGVNRGRGKHALFSAATEADARAKTLIYLLENKLITL